MWDINIWIFTSVFGSPDRQCVWNHSSSFSIYSSKYDDGADVLFRRAVVQASNDYPHIHFLKPCNQRVTHGYLSSVAILSTEMLNVNKNRRVEYFLQDSYVCISQPLRTETLKLVSEKNVTWRLFVIEIVLRKCHKWKCNLKTVHRLKWVCVSVRVCVWVWVFVLQMEEPARTPPHWHFWLSPIQHNTLLHMKELQRIHWNLTSIKFLWVFIGTFNKPLPLPATAVVINLTATTLFFASQTFAKHPFSHLNSTLSFTFCVHQTTNQWCSCGSKQWVDWKRNI